jgi:hypothetical protein
MLDAIGGSRNFVLIVKRDIFPSLERAIRAAATSNRIFGKSAAPAKPMTPSEELNSRSDPARKLALSARDTKCTLPAKEARLTVPVANVWEISCVEGNYTLILESGQSTVMKR